MNKLTWDEIPLSRSKFAQQFKNRPLEDLLVSEFDLILKHKQWIKFYSVHTIHGKFITLD